MKQALLSNAEFLIVAGLWLLFIFSMVAFMVNAKKPSKKEGEK